LSLDPWIDILFTRRNAVPEWGKGALYLAGFVMNVDDEGYAINQ